MLRRCVEILEWEGAGHTFAIHTEDADTAKRFAAAVPASRVLVNTPAALGGIGATTCLFPALTLGWGPWISSTSSGWPGASKSWRSCGGTAPRPGMPPVPWMRACSTSWSTGL